MNAVKTFFGILAIAIIVILIAFYEDMKEANVRFGQVASLQLQIDDANFRIESLQAHIDVVETVANDNRAQGGQLYSNQLNIVHGVNINSELIVKQANKEPPRRRFFGRK